MRSCCELLLGRKRNNRAQIVKKTMITKTLLFRLLNTTFHWIIIITLILHYTFRSWLYGDKRLHHTPLTKRVSSFSVTLGYPIWSNNPIKFARDSTPFSACCRFNRLIISLLIFSAISRDTVMSREFTILYIASRDRTYIFTRTDELRAPVITESQ